MIYCSFGAHLVGGEGLNRICVESKTKYEEYTLQHISNHNVNKPVPANPTSSSRPISDQLCPVKPPPSTSSTLPFPLHAACVGSRCARLEDHLSTSNQPIESTIFPWHKQTDSRSWLECRRSGAGRKDVSTLNTRNDTYDNHGNKETTDAGVLTAELVVV